MLRTASWSCSWGILSLVSLLLLLSLARHHQTDAASMYRTASDSHVQRLCSSNLSDALFLLCKGRGFNGPFGNSGEVSSSDSKSSSSTYSQGDGFPSGGLVDECCIQSCTLEQMEQYCMPPPPSKTD